MVKEMALDFNLAALQEIADAAQHRARLIAEIEPKPWLRTQEQNDARDTFSQLAAYCRRVIEMANS